MTSHRSPQSVHAEQMEQRQASQGWLNLAVAMSETVHNGRVDAILRFKHSLATSLLQASIVRGVGTPLQAPIITTLGNRDWIQLAPAISHVVWFSACKHPCCTIRANAI